MKKLGIFALAALLVAMFTLPAAAVEHEFGGYWRTRFYTQMNFSGNDDDEAQDVMRTDTRTRLYYTAVLNDSLKLVNKFEVDAVWGASADVRNYGDVGTDGVDVQVKNTYAEIMSGNWLTRIGAQGFLLARGFLQDEDGIGLLTMYMGETFAIPFVWEKVDEGSPGGEDSNEGDIDALVLTPTFHLSETMKINPYVLYIMSEDASKGGDILIYEEVAWWNLGVDFDYAGDAFSAWFTGIIQAGSADIGGTDYDFSGFLLALGGSTNIGAAELHGQFVYASGDDDAGDSDFEQFVPVAGAQYYYWAEIMGYGTFDNQEPAGAPLADNITNVYFGGIGVGFKPADKMKLVFDLWYASRVEEVASGLDESIGTEIDAKLTYELVEGLNLDLVAAYLFAGESVTFDHPDDANPYELGARLSLSF